MDDTNLPARAGALANEGGPWGGGTGGGGGGGNGDDGLGPRNPWSQPPRKRPTGGRTPGPSALDELLRRGKARFGGGGGLPEFGGRPVWVIGIAAIVVLWIVLTSFHQIGPQERGVVTRLGKYSHTLAAGIAMTLPAPLDRVQKVQVDDIREINIDSADASAGNQYLMLTRDENIIDLAFSVRWNIKDPELYLFELADPDGTIRAAAESAMRAEIAGETLTAAMGPQRSAIEARVQQRMQEILDGYRSGVLIQGVAIKQADPPEAVNDAFKSVLAAQQQAQSLLNEARGYATQLTSKAEGEAAAFDKVYAQYRLAPEVTRKRMYYETMEDVLANTDKTVVEAPGVNSYLPLAPQTRSVPAPQATQEAAR